MSLRKAAEMALDGFEQIHQGCGFVRDESGIHKDAKDLATEIRKDCNRYMKALRQALAQSEDEERFAKDWRETVARVEAKLKEKNG